MPENKEQLNTNEQSTSVLPQKTENNQIDLIQKNIRKNRIVFYGFPFMVILYSVAIFAFLIYPLINKYFEVKSDIETLDKNLINLKQTATNIRSTNAKIDELNNYDDKLTAYIPAESRLGTLITEIQKKADDFSLEREVGFPSSLDPKIDDRSTIQNIAKDVNTNDLFQSVNSGELRFTPKSLQDGAEAKLLSIDLIIRGKKDNFLKFMEELKTSKPLLNLTFISYQESPNIDGEPDVNVNIRLESYTLKLDPASISTSVKPYNVNDTAILRPIAVETFNVNPEIAEEFGNQ